MEKIHEIISWTVIFTFSFIALLIELPIKIVGFLLCAVIYMFIVLLAPLACKWRSPQWLDKVQDWAFSTKFLLAKKVASAYYRALLK